MSLKKLEEQQPPLGGLPTGRHRSVTQTPLATQGTHMNLKAEAVVEEDWFAEFRRCSAARPLDLGLNETTEIDAYREKPTVMSKPAPWSEDFDLFGASSTLNTPTMEYDEVPVNFTAPVAVRPSPMLPQATATGASSPAASLFADTAAAASVDSTTVVEMILPVVEGPAFEFPATNANYEGITELWCIDAAGGSPPENIERHAPLMLVEGRAVDAIQQSQLFGPSIPATGGSDGDQSESLGRDFSQLITATAEATTLVGSEDQLVKEEMEEEESMTLADQETSLVDWIINDAIRPDSEFPVAAEVDPLPVQMVVSPPRGTAVLLLSAPLPTAAAAGAPVTINAEAWSSLHAPAQPILQPPRGACNSAEEGGVRLPPVKRNCRGRPPVPLERPILPPLPRARRGTQPESEDSDLTEQDVANWRYRRSRDLNNVASKRCRENRKRRHQEAEEEALRLEARNIELNRRLRALEAKVRKFKEIYMQHILPGGRNINPAYLDVLWSDE